MDTKLKKYCKIINISQLIPAELAPNIGIVRAIGKYEYINGMTLEHIEAYIMAKKEADRLVMAELMDFHSKVKIIDNE